MSLLMRRRALLAVLPDITPDRFWADATQVVGLSDGDTVQRTSNLVTSAIGQWGDTTLNDNFRVRWRAAGVNGMPSYQYEGSDRSYLFAAPLPDSTAVNPFNTGANYPMTIVSAVRPSALADAAIFGQGSSSSGFWSTFFTGLGITSGGQVRAAITNNGGAVAQGGAISAGNDYLLTALLESGAMAVRVNGSEVASSTTTGSPFNYTWATIGATDGGGNTGSNHRSPYNGYIGELRLYGRRLNPTELATVEAFLMDKWGI